jgi:gluconolactonase
LYRLGRDGHVELLLDRLDGRPLGSANFVVLDARHRIWVTISARTVPRLNAVQEPIPDGFLLVFENGRARVAAEGLHFVNEVRIDRKYRHLYVAETALGRVTRFPLLDNGTLGSRETFGPDTLFPRALVDGLAFDAAGNVWVTEVSRNSIFTIASDGDSRCIFADPTGATLPFLSSLAFAGPDLRTVYVGSTRLQRLGMFRSPIAVAGRWSRCPSYRGRACGRMARAVRRRRPFARMLILI